MKTTTALAIATILACAWAAFGAPLQDFSWIQITDIHYPHADSGEFLEWVAGQKTVPAPGREGTVAPAFILATGDLFEYGDGSGWWDEFRSKLAGASVPVRMQAGNHDDTWRCFWPRLRAAEGSPWYSFDFGGIHFVGLSSATPQDPRPSFGEEEITWLRSDLADVPETTPLVVFFHHPLAGKEYASDWSEDRVLDLLRPFRRVVTVTGHYHHPRLIRYEGFDCLVGGQGYQDRAGYTVFEVRDGVLTAAYRKRNEPAATNVLLKVDLRTPDHALALESEMRLIGPKGTPTAAFVEGRMNPVFLEKERTISARVDDGDPVSLMIRGKSFFEGKVPFGALDPGFHRLNVVVENDEGYRAERTFLFAVSPPPEAPPVLWQVHLPQGIKGAPAVFGNRLAVPCLGGTVVILDAGTGAVAGAVPCEGEVLASPVALGSNLLVADGSGVVRAVDPAGKTIWRYDGGAAVYSTPAVEGNRVYAVNIDGTAFALDASSGDEIWKTAAASYAVESPVILADGRMFFAAWDRYVYALDAETGNVLWKCMGEGSATKPAARYYSPADAPLVFAGGSLFAADRAMLLARIDPEKGERTGRWEKCSALAGSVSGDALYLRRTNGRLTKMTPSGDVVWESDAETGFMPAPPVEVDGVVCLVSGTGLVQAFDAETGKALWKYRAAPGVYVFAPPAAGGSRLYVGAVDGSLTAFDLR